MVYQTEESLSPEGEFPIGVGTLDVLLQDEEARVGELALLALVAEPGVDAADVVRQLLLGGGGEVTQVAPQLVNPLDR